MEYVKKGKNNLVFTEVYIPIHIDKNEFCKFLASKLGTRIIHDNEKIYMRGDFCDENEYDLQTYFNDFINGSRAYIRWKNHPSLWEI